ncbi:MAG: TraR/DksA family transcriptional regulator [Flavobacteriales bacterium]|jgi:DnaK suppressor protein|nr:TraR/DksA family transcriptional regulator [Flavobacteriales bacterium]MBT5933410.1 TraR/DksA family transcriptional regulator [Flavobacteriales bacterium]MDA8910980.1 TraR/DksA family transcriptional regulator [Crocinitomicaceae bacterium]MDC3308859.1 TraR/DksA family transcriptional regulator [Crocinitomicaceae bacterium]
MNKDQKQDIKKRILEELKKTEEAILDYKESTKPISPENAIGRVSRMDAINNKSVVEAALRKAEEKLNKLKLVLNKVDDADFGICIRCGEPIPIGRVLLMPQSRNCVRCAQ